MYSAQLLVGFLISNFWSVKMCYTWSVKCITQTIKIVQTPSGILYNSPVLKETKFISFIHDLASFCFSNALDVTFLVISRLVCKISHNLVKFSELDEHPTPKCVFFFCRKGETLSSYMLLTKCAQFTHFWCDTCPLYLSYGAKIPREYTLRNISYQPNTALRNILNNRTFIRTSLMLPCAFIQ